MYSSNSSVMKKFKVMASMALCVVVSAFPAHAQAAELLVWSAGAAKAPISQVVQEYQKTTGNAIKIDYAPVGALMKKLADGGKPDVLLISMDVIQDVERNGWTVPGSSTPVGSVGVGIAVREGASVPDISSPEALRNTLLNAKTITYMDPTKGTSGKHFASVLTQLGVADQVKGKTILGEGGFIVEPVARGEIELGIHQITEILPVKGVHLVGPLPPTLQKITTYTMALGAHASNVEVAREFMRFVKRDGFAAVFRAKGFSTP